MIVSELIEQLTKLPQDALVLGRGYESGYNEVNSAEVITVVRMIDNASYDGDYERKEYTYINKFIDKEIQAVSLL